MTDQPTPPPVGKQIVVNPSVKPTLFWTGVRIAVFLAVGFLLRPYVPDILLNVVLPHLDGALWAALVGLPTLFVSIRSTLAKHRKLALLAWWAPNRIAVVKGAEPPSGVDGEAGP